MANYTPTFTKPYPSGWVDKPSKTTPVTAAIMKSYDTAIAALEAYLRDNAIKNVSADTTVKSGTKIATITIDGTEYVLYSPGVSYESAITGGTKVGTITVGANTFDVYAPTSSAGGSTVSVVPKTLTGTNIAEITVDGTTYQLYAPTSGGSGSTVTAEATLTDGTQIGKITIDGVETILYAPNGTGGSITVDSALSTESENPVQNKAIAEEFQKYANGTKVVAKATEANTATTASNAEKVNGHTVGADVPSNAVFTDTVYDDSTVKASIQNIVNGTTQVGKATKATQDAQGNVIDTTYAKKTEVPQGTVVDDALSSTSANPVQNKVVKAEFDKVNSNLDGLGYGDNGAKNLFEDEIKWMENITVTRGTKSVSDGKITLTATSDDCYTEHDVSSWKNNGIKTVPCKPNTKYTFSWEYEGGSVGDVYIFENGSTNNMAYAINKAHKLTITTSADAEYLIVRVGVNNPGTSITYWNLQLEEGDTATPYKPYIPSVKMLADEVSTQNESLEDYGLTNQFDGKFTQGFYNTDGVLENSSTRITTTNKIHCKTGSTVNIKSDTLFEWNAIVLYDSSENVLGITSIGEKIVTENVSYIRVYLGLLEVMLSPSTVGRVNIYIDNSIEEINNDIEEIKNDLSNLKDGTTPVAKAVADEDGNNIKSTYATKTELDVKANIADPVFTGSFSQNRSAGSPIGTNSHAEGVTAVASGIGSHAEGIGTIASGEGSHTEGHNAEASGEASHAEGGTTKASGNGSHAEGFITKASGNNSHAEGTGTEASNFSSHSAGKYNASMITGGAPNNTTGTAFVVGNGTSSSSRSNAFSVQYDGTVKAKSTITASTTADYAEFFEWLDENPNNEDRVGYFVTLDGNRIKIASDNDDYILGIVSGEPFVLGNGDCDTWNGMYLHDEFRRTIYEPAPKVEKVEIKEEREETYIDEETGEEKTRTVEVVVGHEFKEVEGEFDGTRPKLNPEYDNTQQYISRFDRKEWSPVGMLGVLAVRHDGTAKVNGYVTVNKNGIATACDRNIENSYRVIKANTDSVVEVIFK